MENSTIVELRKRIEEKMGVERFMLYEDICEVIMDVFVEIGTMMRSQEGLCGGEKVRFASPVAGLPVSVLEQIRDKSEEGDVMQWVTSWTEGEKARYMLAFLNVNALSAKDFRDKFPRAYTPWLDDDDATLIDMWQQGTKWTEMSQTLGRNVNALKLRLQHLGVDLGAEAGRPRRR